MDLSIVLDIRAHNQAFLYHTAFGMAQCDDWLRHDTEIRRNARKQVFLHKVLYSPPQATESQNLRALKLRAACPYVVDT